MMKKIYKMTTIFIVIINLIFTPMFSSKETSIKNNQYLYGSSDFDNYASLAQNEMKENGIFASLTLAQAALESGLGAHAPGNNFFGIKANCSWSGPTTGNLNTNEYENGVKVSITSQFRAYSSVSESFKDHSVWLLTCYKNRNDIAAATTLEQQISALSSYATSPTYITNLISIINKYDLTKYDDGIELGKSGLTGKKSSLSNINISTYEAAKYDPNKYVGDIKEGWLYKRFEYKETYNVETDDVQIEMNINDSILEIFDNAVTNYYNIYFPNGIESGPGLAAADAGGYRVRVSMPTLNGIGSAFYFSSANASYANGYLGQCTWYAYGRANEILSTANSTLKWTIASNAGLWYTQNYSQGSSGFKSSNDYTQPKVGAIISWTRSGAPGHVAVVEAVNGNNVTISEANISSAKSSSNPYGWQTTTLTLNEVKNRWSVYNFSGYIYTVD